AYLLAELSRGAVPEAPAEAPASPLPVKPAYEDRTMVYAFSCLEKDSALAGARQSEALLRRASVVNLDPGETTRPQDAIREQEGDTWLQSRWRGFSKDGGVLVVFDTDRFHGRFLGVYQRTYYFDIFLLSALQRVTLLTLFEAFS